MNGVRETLVEADLGTGELFGLSEDVSASSKRRGGGEGGLYAGKTATEAGRGWLCLLRDLLRELDELDSLSGLVERAMEIAFSGGVGGVEVQDGGGSCGPLVRRSFRCACVWDPSDGSPSSSPPGGDWMMIGWEKSPFRPPTSRQTSSSLSLHAFAASSAAGPRSGDILGDAMMGVRGTKGKSADDVGRGARTDVPTAVALLTRREGRAAVKSE